MRQRFHWRATRSNLGYMKELAKAHGMSVNGSLNGIVALLRQHGVTSIADLARLLADKRNVAPLR